MSTTSRKETRLSLWMNWEHKQEERWLDSLSAQGLHLVRAYPFFSRFTKDLSTRYIYRLDYRSEVRAPEQFQEYITLYADSGWEYQCSYLGMWHYFRRPWHPGEPPELYTDRASLRQHYQRIQGLMGAVFFPNLIMLLVNLNNQQLLQRIDFVLVVLALQALMLILLGYGWAKLRQRIKAIDPGN